MKDSVGELSCSSGFEKFLFLEVVLSGMRSIGISEPCGKVLHSMDGNGVNLVDEVIEVENKLVDGLSSVDSNRVGVVIDGDTCVFLRNQRTGGFVWSAVYMDDSEPLSPCPMYNLDELVSVDES